MSKFNPGDVIYRNGISDDIWLICEVNNNNYILLFLWRRCIKKSNQSISRMDEFFDLYTDSMSEE